MSEQPIATVELDEPLEWVDGKADLLLPEGKGWDMPAIQYDIDDGETFWDIVVTWASGGIPKDAIIEVRYPDGTSERARVVNVLGVEQPVVPNDPAEDPRYLRCVVAPTYWDIVVTWAGGPAPEDTIVEVRLEEKGKTNND